MLLSSARCQLLQIQILSGTEVGRFGNARVRYGDGCPHAQHELVFLRVMQAQIHVVHRPMLGHQKFCDRRKPLGQQKVVRRKTFVARGPVWRSSRTNSSCSKVVPVRQCPTMKIGGSAIARVGHSPAE